MWGISSDNEADHNYLNKERIHHLVKACCLFPSAAAEEEHLLLYDYYGIFTKKILIIFYGTKC